MKWEYKLVLFANPYSERVYAEEIERRRLISIGKKLTRLGEDNWEAVGFTRDSDDHFHILLKRPKP